MMGPYWGCMAAGRAMREKGGGSIINISSAGGMKPVPGLAVYGMTKAAVNSLTWTSAKELGAYGIRVNAIAPGWIDTPMVSRLYRDALGRIDPAARQAHERSGQPVAAGARGSSVGYRVCHALSGRGREPVRHRPDSQGQRWRIHVKCSGSLEARRVGDVRNADDDTG